MVKLTPKLISQEFPDEDAPSMQKLALSGKGIEKIVRLNACSQLIRLDLSNNNLTSLEGVSQNVTLKWLSAQSNQITALTGLDTLKQLQVLDLGHNALSGRLTITGLPSLRALMLNDNQLTGIEGLGLLPELNTLILKQNQVTDLGTSLHGCTALAKLSVARNRLQQLGSALSECSSLAELRVSHNAVQSLPQELSRNRRLKIIEAGANQIGNFEEVQVLSQLPSLHQLNLRGCPIADKPDYQQRLLQQLPMLDVLDSKKIAKTGFSRGAKSAVAAMMGKQVKWPSFDTSSSTPNDAQTHANTPRGDDNSVKGVDAVLKGKKRRFHAETDAADVSTANMVHKEKRKKQGLEGDAEPNVPVTQTAGNKQSAPKSPKQQIADLAAAGAAGDQSKPQQEKKRKAKVKKQSNASDGSRSFLADVLNPLEAQGLPQPPAAKPDNARAATAVPASSPAAATSGLVTVIEAAPAKRLKGKKGKHGKDSVGRSVKGVTGHTSGSSAAQLLQNGLGLDALQVGLGGITAWN
ncbi:hypothetical protein WJX77_004420 [Trebouxia sp. C0004]